MFVLETLLNREINLSFCFNSHSCSIWNACVNEELKYTLLYTWISYYLSYTFVWQGCQREKGRLSSTRYTGVSVAFDLFACPVHRFLCFKLSVFVCLFITASLWKKWDTLGKFTSSRGFSLPLRLESAICRKALGNNIEFEIHYSVLIRFILKNLYVHWPWLGKWYHKIRIFFFHSVIVLYSV